MNASADHDELRDAEITRRAWLNFQAARAAILRREQSATTDAANSLLEYAANSPEWPELIRTTLCGSADVTGKALAGLLVKVMQDDAEVEAIKEVEQLEQAAQQEPDNFRPQTRAQAVALDWLRAGA